MYKSSEQVLLASLQVFSSSLQAFSSTLQVFCSSLQVFSSSLQVFSSRLQVFEIVFAQVFCSKLVHKSSPCLLNKPSELPAKQAFLMHLKSLKKGSHSYNSINANGAVKRYFLVPRDVTAWFTAYLMEGATSGYIAFLA